MNIVSVSDPNAARSYIQSLELPSAEPSSLERDGSAPVLPKYSNQKQAVVVGSQIVEFAANVPAELRPAISNTFLLAQLAANKKIGQGNAGTKQWYDKYNEVLANSGWVVESSADSTKEVTGSGLEVHKEIVPVIATVLGPAVAAASVVSATLNGLARMDKESSWITLFDHQSQRAHANQFQISYAAAPQAAAPQVTVACFELDASRSITRFLFFKFAQSSAKLRYFSTTLSLNAGIFEQVRGQVETTIAKHVARYLANIEI